MFYSCYLYLFTYWCSTRFPDQITFMLFLQWNRNCFPSGAPEFTTVFEGFLFMCDIFKNIVLFAIKLSILRFTASYYPFWYLQSFGIFNLLVSSIFWYLQSFLTKNKSYTRSEVTWRGHEDRYLTATGEIQNNVYFRGIYLSIRSGTTILNTLSSINTYCKCVPGIEI